MESGARQEEIAGTVAVKQLPPYRTLQKPNCQISATRKDQDGKLTPTNIMKISNDGIHDTVLEERVRNWWV